LIETKIYLAPTKAVEHFNNKSSGLSLQNEIYCIEENLIGSTFTNSKIYIKYDSGSSSLQSAIKVTNILIEPCFMAEEIVKKTSNAFLIILETIDNEDKSTYTIYKSFYYSYSDFSPNTILIKVEGNG
jgi:hypothetical protein